jgi:hypothetical protein
VTSVTFDFKIRPECIVLKNLYYCCSQEIAKMVNTPSGNFKLTHAEMDTMKAMHLAAIRAETDRCKVLEMEINGYRYTLQQMQIAHDAMTRAVQSVVGNVSKLSGLIAAGQIVIHNVLDKKGQ